MTDHLRLAAWMVLIPFLILLAAINITLSVLTNLFVPEPVADWFSDRFDGPGGLTRKPFSKWKTL